MQRASVYRFPDRLLVVPHCRTPMGILLSSEPYSVLPLEISDHELGAAIEAALLASSRTVAHPTDWKTASAPRLNAAGVKSERAFQQRSTLVQVCKTAESVRVVLSHNGGAAGAERGFHGLANVEIVIPLPSPTEGLAVQVRRAFEQCTS
jgi:hypothetical protein